MSSFWWRSPVFTTAFFALLCLLAPRIALAETASSTVAVVAQIDAHTALWVSSSMLEFHVSDDPTTGPPAAFLDFQAAARVPISGEVVISVEAGPPLSGAPGWADAHIAVTGYGGDSVFGSRVLDGHFPQPVGRWVGSGRRSGRLRFTLYGRLSPGSYTLPVRLILSAP